MNSKRAGRALYTEAHRIAQEGNPSEVLALLDSPDLLIRRWAINAIGRRRLAGGAAALQRLATSDRHSKLAAMMALEQLALPETRSTFIEGLADEDVHATALRGLLAIGDPQTVSAAEDAYRKGSRLMRREALWVLQRA